MKVFHGMLGLSLGFLLSACATTATRSELSADAFQPAVDSLTVGARRADYRIGPDDLLNITVFQVADLERDVRVNNAGQISLPLIGTINAAGLSVPELTTQIEQKFRERFLQNPQVSVFVKEFASQRVTVDGAVSSPGIFPVTTKLSLIQTIALAKGLTNVANERRVIVFRTMEGRPHLARFDLEAIREGRAADPEILGEDIVVVDESSGKIWLRRFIELTPLIGVWSVFR